MPQTFPLHPLIQFLILHPLPLCSSVQKRLWYHKLSSYPFHAKATDPQAESCNWREGNVLSVSFKALRSPSIADLHLLTILKHSMFPQLQNHSLNSQKMPLMFSLEILPACSNQGRPIFLPCRNGCTICLANMLCLAEVYLAKETKGEQKLKFSFHSACQVMAPGMMLTGSSSTLL